MKRAMRLLLALGYIDEKYIEDAALPQKKKIPWGNFAAAAACVLIAAGVLISQVPQFFRMGSSAPDEYELAEATEEAADEDAIDYSASLVMGDPRAGSYTLDEIEEYTGFKTDLPDSVGGFSVRELSIIGEATVMAAYLDEDGNVGAYIYKFPQGVDAGGGTTDNAARKNDAASSAQESALQIEFYGEDGAFTSAAWENGGFSYEINAPDGMTKDELTAAINETK